MPITGDFNNDGRVDYSDVTHVLSLMHTGEASFDDVKLVLANFNAMEWRVPLEPWQPESTGAVRRTLAWSLDTGCDVITERRFAFVGSPLILAPKPGDSRVWSNTLMPRATPSCPGVILDGWTLGAQSLGLISKVLPPRGYDRSRCWLWLRNCTIVGDAGSIVTVATLGEWGGGVWTEGLAFDSVQSCIPGAMAHVGLRARNITSDMLSQVRGAYDCEVDGIQKPADSKLHPDVNQHSWPSFDPGPMAFKKIKARNAHAQGFFVNSTAPITALALSDIDVECKPGNGMKSQIAGSTIGELLIENFRLRNQVLWITNNSRPAQIARHRISGLDIPPGFQGKNTDGFRADPNSGVTVTPEMFTAPATI